MVRDIHYCYLIKPYESSAWKWNKKVLKDTDIHKFGMSSETDYKENTCLARINAYDAMGTDVLAIWEFRTREQASKFEREIISYILANFDGVEGTREYFHLPEDSYDWQDEDPFKEYEQNLVNEIDRRYRREMCVPRNNNLRRSHRQWHIDTILRWSKGGQREKLEKYDIVSDASRLELESCIDEQRMLPMFINDNRDGLADHAKEKTKHLEASLRASLEEYQELVDTLRHQNEELNEQLKVFKRLHKAYISRNEFLLNISQMFDKYIDEVEDETMELHKQLKGSVRQ